MDGGATVAFAALDYEGHVVALESRKNWPRQELVQMLARFDPEVIASDTRPAGRLAEELCHYFPARLHQPLESLSHGEKNSAAARTPVKCRNHHERDALAAALKAYHALENKLRQAGAHAHRAGLPPEAVQHLVLRGERMDEAAQSLETSR